MESLILTLVVFAPLLGVLALLAMPRTESARPFGVLALVSSLITLALNVIAAAWFAGSDPDAAGYRLSVEAPWIVSSLAKGSIDIAYRVGVDGIGLALLTLTSFLQPLIVWSSFSSIQTRAREYYVLLLLLQVAMAGAFCATDLLLFFVFFEFTLVPLYFLIAVWGGPERKRAANKFFLFTVAGSVLTFAGLIYLGYFAYHHTGKLTLSMPALTELALAGGIPFNVQWWLFLAFAAGFAIKVPLFPVHTWLPLAHTEAPTAGSVVLAGVLLKLGTYGFCRISIPMLPDAAEHFAPHVAVLSIIGIIYAALAAWVQRDVKKLVAYSSVSHLGFCMLGLFSLKIAGVTGAVLYMVNHGLSTGALFLVVGCLYERYHTRDIHTIGGLARRMPWLGFFLVFFTLSSIALPGLNGFVSEFLVLFGTATSTEAADGLAAGPLGYAYVVPAALGVILGAVYMLWMCRRVLFGPLAEPPHTPDTSQGLSHDLTGREIGMLAPIALACVLIGVYPKPFLESIEPAVAGNVLSARTPEAHQARALAARGAQADARNVLDRQSAENLVPEGDVPAFNRQSTIGNRQSAMEVSLNVR